MARDDAGRNGRVCDVAIEWGMSGSINAALIIQGYALTEGVLVSTQNTKKYADKYESRHTPTCLGWIDS